MTRTLLFLAVLCFGSLALADSHSSPSDTDSAEDDSSSDTDALVGDTDSDAAPTDSDVATDTEVVADSDDSTESTGPRNASEMAGEDGGTGCAVVSGGSTLSLALLASLLLRRRR